MLTPSCIEGFALWLIVGMSVAAAIFDLMFWRIVRGRRDAIANPGAAALGLVLTNGAIAFLWAYYMLNRAICQ